MTSNSQQQNAPLDSEVVGAKLALVYGGRCIHRLARAGSGPPVITRTSWQVQRGPYMLYIHISISGLVEIFVNHDDSRLASYDYAERFTTEPPLWDFVQAVLAGTYDDQLRGLNLDGSY